MKRIFTAALALLIALLLGVPSTLGAGTSGTTTVTGTVAMKYEIASSPSAVTWASMSPGQTVTSSASNLVINSNVPWKVQVYEDESAGSVADGKMSDGLVKTLHDPIKVNAIVLTDTGQNLFSSEVLGADLSNSVIFAQNVGWFDIPGSYQIITTFAISANF